MPPVTPLRGKYADKAFQALLKQVTRSPWTKTWEHTIYNMKPPRNSAGASGKLVPLKDRIKQWNIVTGDRIRIRNDRVGAIQEVVGVNKLRNLVYVRNPNAREDRTDTSQLTGISYSECQLYLGERDVFTPGQAEPTVVPIFAKRIGCTAPKWTTNLARFDWKRFAVRTTPRLGEKGEKERIMIPWPQYKEPDAPPIQPAVDTPEDVVKEITWQPSLLFYPPSNYGRVKRLQDAYLHSIRPLQSNIPTLEYTPETSPPIEYMLGDELSNPHSRAKKQHRAKIYIEARKRTHIEFVKEEVEKIGGRDRKQAVAEAEWKWTELQRKERRARQMVQWKQRGGLRNQQLRLKRIARKEARRERILQKTVLKPATNQTLPPTPSL